MDAKALMRSRMREAAKGRPQKIDSPLVRYNELGQPVCKVCNVIVKSETLWTPHLASRSHKTAVEELKAKAKAAVPASQNPRSPIDLLKSTSRNSLLGSRPSSALPTNFFDPVDPKRSHTGVPEKVIQSSQHVEDIKSNVEPIHSDGNSQPTSKTLSTQLSDDNDHPIPVKGVLPEGFFDSVDADHRARGLEPPKIDMQDEWKEFQKTIKDDLLEVDFRQEEEEFEAAEEREEQEQMVQRTYLQRIEALRKEKLEKAATMKAKPFLLKLDEIDDDESSEESEDDDNLFVDWRAKHV